MSKQSQETLHRVEGRIKEMPLFTQASIYNLATVLEEFVRANGALGHVALNLTTARMADAALSQ